MGQFSGICAAAKEVRLDVYAADVLHLLSRSQLKARLASAEVNGKTAKLSRLVKAGDAFSLAWEDAPPEHLIPEEIPLDMLYEDARVAVVNKSAGMTVHPGAGNPSGTLANALLWRRMNNHGVARNGTEGNYSPRTGIVHRLDKETSGVIIAAYDDEALAFLSSQFKNRQTAKRYLAIVRGVPHEKAGFIDAPLARDKRDRKKFAVSPAGKPASTRWKVLRSWGSFSLLLVAPKTGRTHQIRVHLNSIGHPIVGDEVYGGEKKSERGGGLMLHAYKLGIVLPGGKEKIFFTAPVPQRMKEFVKCQSRA